MPKPPRTPPHSDLDGVDEDRRRLDEPANSEKKTIDRLEQERKEAKGRPRGSRP
jgi:hypothetical protein